MKLTKCDDCGDMAPNGEFACVRAQLEYPENWLEYGKHDGASKALVENARKSRDLCRRCFTAWASKF